MDKSQFSSLAPGQLVQSWVWGEVRGSPRREKEKVQGLAFIPDALPPQLDWERVLGRLIPEFGAAERAIGSLDGKGSRLENPHLLLRPFLRREARLSSLIEDTIATPKEIVLAEAGESGDRHDPKEVLNYVRALEHGLASELPLVKRLFNEMHGILLSSGVRGDSRITANYRQLQNYIGRRVDGFASARFVPPPSGQPLEECMKSFEQFVNEPPANLPRLVAIALAHYQFEAIHPYEDGNGRLGRLLIPLMLCKYGFLEQPYIYVSAFFERNEAEYKDLLLAVSTNADWESWIRFCLQAIRTQAIDAHGRIDKLLALWKQYASAVTGKRTSSLQRRLIDQLFYSPVVTIPFVRDLLKVSDTAARSHVNSLIDLGVLEEIQSRGRKQFYIAPRILEVTDDELT
jgi:Fic family protein